MAAPLFLGRRPAACRLLLLGLSSNRCDSATTRRCVANPLLVQDTVKQQNTAIAHFHISCNKTCSSRHVNEAIVTDEKVEGQGPWMADLRKRGLYSDSRYGHYHKYKIKELSVSGDKKNINVTWNDGHTSEFDAIWLRHACHCKACKHDMNGMGKIEWSSLPLNITVLSAELEGDQMVVFVWGTPEGRELHRGAIPTATLRCYCYSDKAIRDRRNQRAIKFFDDKTIPALDYDEFQASDKGVYKCMTHVNDRGICLLKNVPTDQDTFRKTIQLIGPIQSTMYGETFEVISMKNPINAAYSGVKLNLHMDLPFYETAPGLQILHCWRFDKDIVGGDSTFVDIHEVAHKFRDEHPDFFDRLARFPVNFNSIHYNRPIPVHMENQKTIFSLNHFGELVSVTWHPMVQGPTELPKKNMTSFYEAYTAFYKMLTQHQSVYKNRFDVGDMVIFNNRRIVHGRDAFEGSGRHLQGAYVELSDFHSYIQALHNKYGSGRLATRSGSHSWF